MVHGINSRFVGKPEVIQISGTYGQVTRSRLAGSNLRMGCSDSFRASCFVVSVSREEKFGPEGCCNIYGKEFASESGRYKGLEKSGKKGGCKERVDRPQGQNARSRKPSGTLYEGALCGVAITSGLPTTGKLTKPFNTSASLGSYAVESDARQPIWSLNNLNASL